MTTPFNTDSYSAEDHAVMEAAGQAVEAALINSIVAVMANDGSTEFVSLLKKHYLNVLQVEDLLVLTAKTFPHLEPEAFSMYVALGAARDTSEKLLIENGIIPLVVDL